MFKRAEHFPHHRALSVIALALIAVLFAAGTSAVFSQEPTATPTETPMANTTAMPMTPPSVYSDVSGAG